VVFKRLHWIFAAVRAHRFTSSSCYEYAGTQQPQPTHRQLLHLTYLSITNNRQQLKYDIANISLHPTDKQREAITNRTNALQRWIDSWISIQELYMPIVLALHLLVNSKASAPDAVLKPQHCHLYLPSSIDTHLHCDQCTCCTMV
jgi:hypothetical protein